MSRVGRRRKHDKHLPERVYHRHGAYYYVPLDGKWKRLAKGYSDALKALAALLGEGAPVQTIELLIAKYDVDELSKKAKKTRAGRLQQFKAITQCFGHMSAEEIEPHHVWNFWKTQGETEQARHEVRALSVLLTFARQIGARKQENPCFDLGMKGAKHRTRYVTDDEFLLVRGIAQPMIGYAMDLALIAGMDEGTIRMLERRHIKAEGIEFERPKKGDQETAFQLIEWNDELDLIVKAILRERPQLRRALICNRKGQPYTANGFQSQWQRTMRKAVKAGLEDRYHFHDLRAKSASDDETDQGASDRLGHADVATTRRIYRRLPRRATALKILDK
jgi:integrase